MTCRVPRRGGLVALILAVALCACGGGQPPEVTGALVEVAGEGIDVAELRDYRDRLPESLRPTGESEDNLRDLLRPLADGRIMRLEAETLGYHRDPEFLERQHKLLTGRLVETIVRQQLGPKIEVAEEEIQKVYHEYHWDREILPAHILSATEADAREVIRLLEEGRDFGELARERSLAADADRGGFLGQYFGPNDAVVELSRAVHGLPVGEFTRTPVRTRDGFEVVKVLDDKPVPYEQVRPRLARAIYLRKFLAQRREYLGELEAEYQVAYDSRGVAILGHAASARTALTEADRDLPLVTYAGGRSIRVGAAGRLLSDYRVVSGDSARVIQAIGDRLLADSLLVLEARAAGLDTTREYVEFRDHLYQRMLVTFLRKKEVLEKITVTEDELRDRYETHRDKFRIPDRVDVRQIVVATRAEAETALRRLRAGEEFLQLVGTLSIQPGAARTGGHLHVTEADSQAWGDGFERIWNASEGDLVGPLEVADGYAVVRVQAVFKDRYRTFADMRLALTHQLKLARQYEAFEDYIAGLRERYADRIVWHDDRIAALAARPEWRQRH